MVSIRWRATLRAFGNVAGDASNRAGVGSAQDGELLFKTDIISDTEEVIYLEGVWTNEKTTRNGTRH